MDFYQLEETPSKGSTIRDQGPAVLLGPIQLADYLQREVIVQRHADGHFSAAPHARWAGSLHDNLAQVLAARLASGLGSSRIAIYPDRVGFDAQRQVLVSVTRLDSGPEQPAQLHASWRILDGDGRLLDSGRIQLSERHNASVVSQIAAQGILVQRLGDELAQAIGKSSSR